MKGCQLVRVVCLSLITAFLVVSCTTDHEPLRVSVITWPGCGFGYLAEHLGYYENLDVEFVVLNETSHRRAAYRAGRVDLLITTADSLAVERAAGIEGTVIMATDVSRGSDGLAASISVTGLEGLAGRKVAFAEGTPSHFLLLDVLRRTGLDFSSIQPITVDDPSTAATLLLANQTDAAVTWEPYLSEIAGHEGFHVLASSAEMEPIIVGGYLVPDVLLGTRRGDIELFVRGWQNAVEHFKAHRNNDLAVMAEALQIAPGDLDGMFQGVSIPDLEMNRNFLDGSPAEYCSLVERAAGYYVEWGLISPSKTGEIECTSTLLPEQLAVNPQG